LGGDFALAFGCDPDAALARNPAASFNPGFAAVDSGFAAAAGGTGFAFAFASFIVPIM